MQNFAVFKAFWIFHPINWFLFFFFLTIQFTKLQVILSLEEEIACIIRSTINKHDKPRNSLLSRDRKSGVKKSNMTHIPPIPNVATFYLRQQAKTKPTGNVIQSCLCHLSKFPDVFSFLIIQIYFKIWQFIKAYNYPIIKKF